MIWGCDLGSRRIALVCPETHEAHELRLKPRRKKDPADAAGDARALADFVRLHVPPGATLWIEKAIVGGSGNRQTAIHMAIANGAALGAHLGPSFYVLPMVWKAAVVGHGHADKERCHGWLTEHWPAAAAACKNSEDLIDAACVGLYGELVASGGLEEARALPRSRRPRRVLRGGQQAADGQGGSG